jgi:hypothetical protein
MLNDIRIGIYNYNYEMTVEEYNILATEEGLEKLDINENDFSPFKRAAVAEKMVGMDWGYPERAFCSECRYFGNCDLKFKDCPYKDGVASYFKNPNNEWWL